MSEAGAALRFYGDEAHLAIEVGEGQADIYVDSTRDVTTVQVGKIQMAVSRTGVRVVSREGPATGHASCHEVELWKGSVPDAANGLKPAPRNDSRPGL